jgi:hypothetical protein
MLAVQGTGPYRPELHQQFAPTGNRPKGKIVEKVPGLGSVL